MKIKSEWFWLLVRFSLGGLFLYSGLSKAVEPASELRAILYEYVALPDALVPLCAAVFPWIEMIAGLFLIAGYAIRLSAVLVALSSLGFIFLLSSQFFLTGQFPDDCGCFGAGWWKPTAYQVLLLDVLDFFLALKLWSLRSHRLSLDRWLIAASDRD